jgi:hypothetical protein
MESLTPCGKGEGDRRLKTPPTNLTSPTTKMKQPLNPAAPGRHCHLATADDAKAPNTALDARGWESPAATFLDLRSGCASSGEAGG